METHTAIGAAHARAHPAASPGVAPLVRSAHERYDGGGYPDGLGATQIPRGAMIIATCDAYHAMTSDRSYRKAIAARRGDPPSCDAGAGTQFDPAVVSALIAELG